MSDSNCTLHPASNGKHSRLSIGAILPLLALPNAQLHSPPSKATSFQGLFSPSSGSKNAAWCQDSASAMNWFAEMKGCTATLHAYCTRNWSIGYQNRGSWRSSKSKAQLRLRWSSLLLPSWLNWLEWFPLWCVIASNFALIQLLITFGCHHHYKVWNPFEWMEMISLLGKTNIFEKHVGEDSKSGVGVDRADETFALEASFWWEWTQTHTKCMLHRSRNT